jgi:hypothetical protein
MVWTSIYPTKVFEKGRKAQLDRDELRPHDGVEGAWF